MDLTRLLEDAAEQIEHARSLSADAWFSHFALGVLRRDDALRFIEIHTDHHLAIVDEILAACGAQQGGFTRD